MKKRIQILVFVLMILFFLLSSTNLLLREETEEIKKVSVIVPGDEGLAAENFRRGIREAANEERVEINYIILGRERGAITQSEQIERERQGEAQAIILEVKDPEGLRQYLERKESMFPLITVNSPGDYPCETCGISFDTDSAAESLVQKVLEEDVKRVVCVRGEKKLSEQMCRILKEKLAKEGIKAEEIEPEQLKEKQNEKEIFIGCGTEETEAVLRTVRRAAAVYGTGYSDTIREEIEGGRVRAVVTGSMYSMGVHAVRAAVSAIEERKTEREIFVPVRLITRENLKEEQKFLYPIH